MKRTLTIIAAAVTIAATTLFTAPAARAQAPQECNEINVGYGQLTFMDAAHFFGGALATLFTAGYATFDNFKSYGSVNAEYYRTLGNVVSLGAAFSWFGGSADIVDNEKVKTGTSEYSGIAIMPAAKFYWFRKQHVAMYSKAALGLMLLKDHDAEAGAQQYDPYFMAQLTLVSIQFGGERLKGYLEFGGGAQGLAIIGLNYAF